MAEKKQKAEEKEPVVYRFTGQPGDHVQGVPAKDLTQRDLEALTAEQQALLAAHLKTKEPVFKLEGAAFAFAKMPEPMKDRDYLKHPPEEDWQ